MKKVKKPSEYKNDDAVVAEEPSEPAPPDTIYNFFKLLFTSGKQLMNFRMDADTGVIDIALGSPGSIFPEAQFVIRPNSTSVVKDLDSVLLSCPVDKPSLFPTIQPFVPNPNPIPAVVPSTADRWRINTTISNDTIDQIKNDFAKAMQQQTDRQILLGGTMDNFTVTGTNTSEARYDENMLREVYKLMRVRKRS